MKKYLLALVLVVLSPFASFALAGDCAAMPEVAKLKLSYETSINELLRKYIKKGDVASVSVVCAELLKIGRGFPEVDSAGAPVGVWDWKYNNTVTLFPDRLAICNGRNFGIWKWIDERSGKAEVRWDDGYIDTFTVSPDQQKLHIVNNLDIKFVAEKIKKRPKN
jgi:hypothetical protein